MKRRTNAVCRNDDWLERVNSSPCRTFSSLGADYMANLSPGWNFSPVSRAEISPRPPKQIFLKRRLRLHGARAEFLPGLRFPARFVKRAGIFSPGWNSEKPHVIALQFQPGLKSELERAQWLCFQRNKMAVSHFSPQFQISARAVTSHVIATKFQPGLKLSM